MYNGHVFVKNGDERIWPNVYFSPSNLNDVVSVVKKALEDPEILNSVELDSFHALKTQKNPQTEHDPAQPTVI